MPHTTRQIRSTPATALGSEAALGAKIVAMARVAVALHAARAAQERRASEEATPAAPARGGLRRWGAPRWLGGGAR